MMKIVRQRQTQADSATKSSFFQWKRICVLLSIFAHIILQSSFCVLAIVPENKNLSNNRGNIHTNQETQREGYYSSRPRGSGDGNGNDDSNGIIQIIESEVWDSSENAWKAERGNRWTNEKGQISPSPAEVFPPDGWQFLGDWKIVVSSSNSNSNGAGMGGSGGDSQGWEYQFQYLQPPKRRRIWLRSLTPTRSPPPRQSSRTQASRIVPKPSPPTESAGVRTKVKKIRRIGRFVRTMRQIRDDWNYKGLGLNLYKSFVFPSSVGLAIRLPLSINFDTFDRNPSWPIITSSAAVFYPPMMGGFLSGSVHVEWLKWVAKSTLGLIPALFFWILYRAILPILWTIASAMLFPLKGLYALPPRPTKIPNGSWWTGRSFAKPQYNAEMQERLGCSISYRWSKRRGYEFRVSYWHSYLPTLLVYQQFLSQLEERLKGTFKSGGSSSSSTSSTISSSTQNNVKNNWWRKHTASLGVTTTGPIPDTPPIGCSANLSLSGLYWGTRDVMRKNSFSTSTSSSSEGSRTGNVITTTISGTREDNVSAETDQDNEDRTMVSTAVRTASMKKSTIV